MLRVVFDPNVLVSAAIHPAGVPGRLVQLALERRVSIVACPALLDELHGVLSRPKFHRYITEDQGAEFVLAIAGAVEMHPDPAVVTGRSRDPADNYLLDLGQSAGVDRIVSGDGDLLSVRDHEPPVITPRHLLEELGAAN